MHTLPFNNFHQVENIVTMVRNEVKGAGLQDTRENCWKFFIDRVRRQLKARNGIISMFVV